jgi:hypothetical protein
MRFRPWLNSVELTALNEDYRSALERFAKQNPQADRTAIQGYVDEFKKIVTKKYKQLYDQIQGVTVPREKRNNVDAYATFAELEAVVDHVRGQVDVAGAMKFTDIEVDAKPVFENDILVIYYAESPRACIKYKGNLPYGWCVARSDASNMFHAYRFKDNEPAFYFVKNKQKTAEEFRLWNMAQTAFSGRFRDKWHFFVLQAHKKAKTNDENSKQYVVTSANNDGDTPMSWKQVAAIEPALAPLQSVFKPVPLTDQEREDYRIFSKELPDEEFAKLPYERKSRFLDIYPAYDRSISDGQFAALPEDLKNKYVGFGIGLSDAQHDLIRGTKLERRYGDVTLEKAKRILNNEFGHLGDEDSPYALNDSEIKVVAGRLDYGNMTLEQVARLAGLYSEPREIDREDDDGSRESMEVGGWNDQKASPAAAEMFEAYIAAKGDSLSSNEAGKIAKYHPSQARSLQLHGDKPVDFYTMKSIFARNHSKDKGFREKEVEERFHKERTKILNKGTLGTDEVEMLMAHSDPKEIVLDMGDKAFAQFFGMGGVIDWFSFMVDDDARKALAERLVKDSDKILPHPMPLLLADDFEKALSKMGGETEAVGRMSHRDISNTFFGQGQRWKTVGAPPDRTQRVVELILANETRPMHWMALALAKASPDPAQALLAANPKVFEELTDGYGKNDLRDLVDFVGKASDPRLSQAIAEKLLKAFGTRGEHKGILEAIKMAPEKAKLINKVRGVRLRNMASEFPQWFADLIRGMDRDEVAAAKDALQGLHKIVDKALHLKLQGATSHVGSIEPEKVDEYLSGLLDEEPEESRAALADEIIARAKEFRFRDPRKIAKLIEHSSDKRKALRTILSKAVQISSWNVSDLLMALGKSAFPGDEIQEAIEAILEFRENIRGRDYTVVDLFSAAPDKERVARIVGKEELTKASLPDGEGGTLGAQKERLASWLKERE